MADTKNARAVSVFLFVNSVKDNLISIGLSIVLLFFVLGFAIYDYLEPERLRNRNAIRAEAATVTRDQEDNLARLMKAATQTMIAAVPPPKDLSAAAHTTYVDTLARGVSAQLKEVFGTLEADAQRRQFAQEGALIRSRLEEEIEALGKRGTINLTIGALFAFSGIGALGYFALWYEYRDIADLGIRFFPKITFVLLLEVFSYFFLNLYRHSIFEIKYFQNEMTNMDSRTLALQGCLLTGDSKMTSKICELLARTERNFVLKKGEVSLHEKEIELHSRNERNFVQNFKEIAEALSLKSQR